MQAIIGVVVLALLIGLGSGMYIGSHWNEAGHSLETIKEQKEEIRIDAAQDKVSSESDTKAVTEQGKIVTVYKDRWHYITKEVPVEVTSKMDSECVIPNRFVSLWDSANQARLPDPASPADEAPSGIKLSDVSEQKEIESEICTANTKQLIGLQEWVTKQHEVFMK
jgi:hypothetical protein